MQSRVAGSGYSYDGHRGGLVDVLLAFLILILFWAGVEGAFVSLLWMIGR